MEGITTSGTTTPVHRHPGPEVWYTLAGQACLETPSRGICSQLAKRFATTDAWQLDVHQDERRVLLVCELDPLFTRACLDRLITLDMKRVPHQLQVLRIVLHDQNQLIRDAAPAQ